MGISLKQVKSSINVTYSELYDLVINSRLIPGATYRLTDYRSTNFLHGQDIAKSSSPNDLMSGTKDQTFRVEKYEKMYNNVYIYAVALQSDGKIIIAGSFDQYQGVVVNNIARLNTDGTIDTTFYTNGGFNSDVLTLAVDRFDRILVGGTFNNYQYMVRLHKNGDLDESFPHQSFDDTVRTIKIDTTDRIWVGGDFRYFTFNGDDFQVDHIACLTDGTDGPAGVLVGGLFSFDARVIIIEIDSSNGRVFIGGEFDNYNLNPASKLIKLKSDLTVDTDFDTSYMFASDNYVKSLTIDNDTNYLYVGGYLTSCNGDTVNNLIRTDTGNTSYDTGFNNTLSTFLDAEVTALKIQQIENGDKKLLIAGSFGNFDGNIVNSLIRLNLPDGYLDTDFSSIVTGPARSINLDSDNKILFADYCTLLRLNTEITANPYFTPQEIHYGATESLVLVARTSSEFETEVSSEQYPQDIIEYNPLVNTIGTSVYDIYGLEWFGGEGEPQDQDGVLYKLYTGTFNNFRRFVTRFEGSYYEDSKKTSYDEPNLVYEYVFDKNEATWSELNPFTGLTGSIHFNGNCGIELDTNNSTWIFGNNDLTIEWFQYVTGDITLKMPIFDYYQGRIVVSIEDGDINIKTDDQTHTFGLITNDRNNWHHLAITRNYDGGIDQHVWRVFQDGQVLGSFNYTGGAGPNFDQGGPLRIGHGLDYNTTKNIYFEGNITNFRVINLSALYTDTYTVPTTTLDTNTVGTILLFKVNNEEDFLYDSVYTETATNITNDDTVLLSIISNPYKGVVSPVSGVFKTGYTYKTTFDGSSETTVSINMVTGEVTEKVYDGGLYDTSSLTLIADSKNESLGGTTYNDINTDDFGNIYYDDDLSIITLPSDFNFLGLTYSNFYLSTNGYLTFNGGNSECCFPRQGYQDLLNNPNSCMPAAIGNPGIVISINGWSEENAYPAINLESGLWGEGGPVQFGHSLYVNLEFEDYIGENDYYSLNGVYENLKPGINHVTSNWSYDESTDTYGLPKSRIRVSDDGTTIEFLDLNYKNLVDFKYYNNLATISSYTNLGDQYGYILRRFDTERNIDVPFDFRGIKYRRYELDYKDLGLGNQYGGITDHYYNNDREFLSTGYHKDFYIFENYPSDNDNSFTNIKWEDNPGPDFRSYSSLYSGQYENNVFLGNLNNVTIKSKFYHNTILSDFRNNTIGNEFYRNTTLNYFNNNKIGDSFTWNILGSFTDNIISDSFEDNVFTAQINSNIIGNNFYSNFGKMSISENKIGRNFSYNNLYGFFSFNTIDNSFANNDIYGNFRYNKIGRDFYDNNQSVELNGGVTASIVGDFDNNIIGTEFYNNRIGNNFHNNNISDNFYYNIINENFQLNNVIAPNFNTWDLSNTEYVYGDYNCTIFKDTNSEYRLSYIDGDGVLNVTSPDAV